jgi:hypothetical protein
VTPALSVVLATDAFATIEPVVQRLRAQTAAARVELVVVTMRPDEDPGGNGLAGCVVVEVEDVVPLPAARAAGIRAATAPLVFVGETHTFPDDGWAEALIDAHDGEDWAAVVPGFGNANPAGTLSWAAFLLDYGAWLDVLPHRELEHIPTYNTAYRRADLLGFGPRLDRLVTPGDELIVELRAAGARFVFEPSARIAHLNVAAPRAWIQERYLGGLLTATSRMERWSWGRRLLYAAGSPLIPVVVLGRVAGGTRAARRAHGLRWSVYPAMLLGAVVSAFGELVGYLGGGTEWADRRMTEYEIHRRRYTGS